MARYVMPQVQDTISWIDRSAAFARDNKGTLMGGATRAVLQAIADHTAAAAAGGDASGFALPGTASAAEAPKEAAEKAES